MKNKKFGIWIILVLFIVLVGGYLAKNIFQLSLKDQIYVGQMAMDDPDFVVGRDEHFPKSDTPAIDAQLLFSVWNRINHTSNASQRLVVSDLKGNILLDHEFKSSGYSSVVNLHPIQQKAGTYRLTWYVEDKAVANKSIVIE